MSVFCRYHFYNNFFSSRYLYTASIFETLEFLSANDFSVVSAAKSIIILIFILNFIRWLIRRVSGFSLSYFEAGVMAGLRNQGFSYMIGHSHSFFANNFSGSLTYKINKYARAFEKLADRIADRRICRLLFMVVAQLLLFIHYFQNILIF